MEGFTHTPSQSEEEGSGSESGEESVSGSESGKESGSDFGSGKKSDSGSQENAVDPKPAEGAQDEKKSKREDEDASTEAVMIQYVHQHEVEPVVRQHVIESFYSMWTVNMSEDLFKNGIVSKSDVFRGRPVMPETRIVVSNV
uniref:Uncharacterized protein n=1 Tax=Solanum tuberosum TaxID=4113 RepID=M1DX97_SOLTU